MGIWAGRLYLRERRSYERGLAALALDARSDIDLAQARALLTDYETLWGLLTPLERKQIATVLLRVATVDTGHVVAWQWYPGCTALLTQHHEEKKMTKIDLWAEPLPRLQLADCFNALLTQEGVLPGPTSLTPAGVSALREGLQSTLADARNAGSLQDESATLITLATLAFVSGDPAEAARLSEQALHVAHTLPGSPLIGHALCNLGNARMAQGDPAAAKQHFVEALKSARAHRDRLSETLVLLNLGQVYEAEGQWPLARLRFREADGVAQRAQLRDIQHAIQIRLGRVAEALGSCPSQPAITGGGDRSAADRRLGGGGRRAACAGRGL